MKSKNDKILLYLGILFIVTALIILTYYIYLNYKSEKLFIRGLNNSVRINSDDTSSEIDFSSDFLEQEPIEVLKSDQKINKVVNYKSVMKIPKLKITANIYDGTTQEILRYGLGRYKNTKQLGEKGNCCVAGHSSVTFNCILNGVENLDLFSFIYVWDKKGTKHTYYLIKKFIVEPTALEVLETTDDSKSFFTLITCTDNGHKRLVLTCVELTKEELSDYKKSINQIYTDELLSIANEDVDMFELYDFINRVK